MTTLLLALTLFAQTSSEKPQQLAAAKAFDGVWLCTDISVDGQNKIDKKLVDSTREYIYKEKYLYFGYNILVGEGAFSAVNKGDGFYEIKRSITSGLAYDKGRRNAICLAKLDGDTWTAYSFAEAIEKEAPQHPNDHKYGLTVTKYKRQKESDGASKQTDTSASSMLDGIWKCSRVVRDQDNDRDKERDKEIDDTLIVAYYHSTCFFVVKNQLKAEGRVSLKQMGNCLHELTMEISGGGVYDEGKRRKVVLARVYPIELTFYSFPNSETEVPKSPDDKRLPWAVTTFEKAP